MLTESKFNWIIKFYEYDHIVFSLKVKNKTEEEINDIASNISGEKITDFEVLVDEQNNM